MNGGADGAGGRREAPAEALKEELKEETSTSVGSAVLFALAPAADSSLAGSRRSDEGPDAARPQIGAFDPSKKKKKKKVRMADDEEQPDVTKVAENLEAVSLSEPPSDALLGLGLKKKKKKKPAGDGADEGVGDQAEANGVEDGTAEAEEGAGEGLGDLSLLKKKKKKVPRDAEELDAAVAAPEDGAMEEEDDKGLDDEEDEDFEEGEGIELTVGLPWEGSDRDYKYEELLDRVFDILRENNPELAGEKRRTIMRPPQVLREGTKKTVFVNFMDLCKTMHRQPEHVMAFLLAELGTNGSLDGQQRLVVKGRFAPKNFEGILRRYVSKCLLPPSMNTGYICEAKDILLLLNDAEALSRTHTSAFLVGVVELSGYLFNVNIDADEYVMCNGCKSPDTILSKENRLFFLRCEQCGSSRSVAPIKAGFVARVGRRKAS
eukprot:SM000088S23739  [mRNA]  locus=s88:539841:544534:+ [translate_table: standard]